MQPRENQMMQQKSGDHSEQQGFFAQKIQIKRSNANHGRTSSMHTTKTHFNKSPFEAKFLQWTGHMRCRKQPAQALKVFINSADQQTQKIQKKKNKNQMQDHPYRLFAINENYQLIYSRTKGEPIVNDKNFMSNQINLHHVGAQSSNCYKRIKQFDINQYSDIRIGSLAFDSRFQSGNLHCAYKNTKNQQYILFIQNDTNSLGYNQWFYFSIQRNQANLKYTFKLVNFKKKHSFFKYGSKPAVFSLHDARSKGQGWSRRGKNVTYEQSPIYIQQLPNSKFYCLSFELTFDHKDDYILIAMNFPYSYTKMVSFLKEAQIIAGHVPQQSLQFTIKSICTSVCGNDVPEVTITRSTEEEKKKMIVIMARQHPGQIWSSYMAEGIIRRLVSKPDEDIKWLLDNYIFKIYPMVNVDGAIYGNFRCDITGTDLNRRWKQTSKLMHPQVYEIKKRIGDYKSNYKIQCCFDLHGHSKDYNIFCYSCKDNQYTCRLLPLIIHKLNPVFHFPSCTFGISRYKETTARAAIYKLIRNQNVLTIENSFFGSKINNLIKQFGPEDLFKMGSDILGACRHFLDKKSKIYNNAKKQIQNRIHEFLNYDKINEQNSGSQSDPSGDQIDLQTKINHIFNKQLIQLQQAKQAKIEKKTPIKIKIQQQSIEIKGKEYKNKKQLTKNNIIIRQIPVSRNQNKTIDEAISSNAGLSPETHNFNNKKSKRTISYTHSKKDKVEQNQLNVSNPVFRERQKKFSVKTIDEPKSERQKVQRRNPIRFRSKQRNQSSIMIRQSIQPEQLSNKIENVRKSDEFIKKFERFIPVSMSMKNRANVTMFQQSLYNEDQTGLISMLLQNKKKIELQKIKRNQKDREKLRSQVESRRWSISGHSNRMRKLINRSGNQLASIIIDTINEDFD